MKYFSSLTLVLTIMLLLSACGGKAVPTPAVNEADIRSTSASVALTMIAQTQAAIPTPISTATPPPPTQAIVNTLAPITAFVPSPDANVTETPSGGSDPCLTKVLTGALEGNKVKIRINNSTKASVNVTVYLNRTIPPAVCGYRAYLLEPGGGLVITDMVEGCFTIWAWNPDPKTYFMVTNGAASCIDSSSQVAFDISNRDIIQR